MSLIRAFSRFTGKWFGSNRLNARTQTLPPIVSNRLISRFGKLSIDKIIVGPKRPQNGYTLFFTEKCSQIRNQNHGDSRLQANQLARIVAQEWNQLTQTDKNEYLEKGKTFLINYKNEKELWKQSLTKEQLETLAQNVKTRRRSLARHRLKAQLKKLDFPTRAQSAFNLFFKERISGSPLNKDNINQRFRQVISEWKTSTPEERAPFVESAKLDKIRYLDDMQKWKNNLSKPENAEELNKLIELRAKGYRHLSIVDFGTEKVKPKVRKVIKKKMIKTKVKSTKSKTKLVKSKSLKKKKIIVKSTKTTTKSKKQKTVSNKKKQNKEKEEKSKTDEPIDESSS